MRLLYEIEMVLIIVEVLGVIAGIVKFWV